jgi:hypothetical protein
LGRVDVDIQALELPLQIQVFAISHGRNISPWENPIQEAVFGTASRYGLGKSVLDEQKATECAKASKFSNHRSEIACVFVQTSI